MKKPKYGNFLLEVFLVAVLTSIIGSILSSVLGVFGNLGILTPLITALVLSAIFVYSIKTHPGVENFLEVVPIVLISASLVELVRVYFPIVPSVITEFTWSSLAILLSSIYLSDTVVRKYIFKIVKLIKFKII